MILDFTNCNNITNGQVEIAEGCLNIKYGVNGTGKSTIAKVIEAFVNNDETLKKELVPYKNIGDKTAPPPLVTGLENIKNVAVFNEEYISRQIFKENELIEDSFSVFVKTPGYDKQMKEIENLLKEVSNTFASHSELDELIDNFSQFISGFGRSNTMAANSIISKAIGHGNLITNVPSDLKKFETYLTNTTNGNNVAWLKWQLTGKNFLDMAEQCPYCSGSITETKKNILKITEEYNAKDIEHLNNILSLLDKLMPYFSDDTVLAIKEIKNNASGMSDQQKEYLVRLKEQVDHLLNNLIKLKNINYGTIKTVDKMADELNNYIIKISLFPNLASELTKEKTDIINSSLESVIKLASKLQEEVEKQNELITNTIKQNRSVINNFLIGAGYNYEVDIVENDDHKYRMILKPRKLEMELSAISRHLSYGEKNALALALFSFSVKKDNPDLVILDDPISSFDGNKRFALINLLFLSDDSLKGRTVLLLTHEFNTVIDIIKVKYKDFDVRPNASFLTTKKEVMSEKRIKSNDIYTIQKVARKNIGLNVDNLIKLIYLRRLTEVEEDYGPIWQMTSSILHKDPYPTIKGEHGIKTPMTEEEKSTATKLIKEKIPDFDYDTEYNKTHNVQYLLDLYNSTSSNFEKLQIFRIIHNDKITNKVVQKFVDEAYHVGNDYVYQLNPRNYDTIPQFVIDECDNEISKVKSGCPA